MKTDQMFLIENFFRRAEQTFCGDWIRFTHNAGIYNARSGKVGSSHCYLDRRPLHEIDEIVYEYENNFVDWYTLHYQE